MRFLTLVPAILSAGRRRFCIENEAQITPVCYDESRFMGRLVQRFLEHVVPGVARPLRVLWNEMIGFFFLVLAAWAVPSAIRYVREYHGDAESLFRLVLSIAFSGVMIYFGITSFLRARRISRS
jgi:hypothetical protein